MSMSQKRRKYSPANTFKILQNTEGEGASDSRHNHSATPLLVWETNDSMMISEGEPKCIHVHASSFTKHKTDMKAMSNDETNETIKSTISTDSQLLTPAFPLRLSPSAHLYILYAPQGPERPPIHLEASCAPYNCSPRSALTWEDWLQAVACSSREQAWWRALGGNNLTSAPPLPCPRPQHELRTGFREKEEKHCVNQRRQRGGTLGKAGGSRRTGQIKEKGWSKEFQRKAGMRDGSSPHKISLGFGHTMAAKGQFRLSYWKFKMLL